jgi:hypothetical protein
MDNLKRIAKFIWDKYSDLSTKQQTIVSVVVIVAFIFIVT